MFRTQTPASSLRAWAIPALLAAASMLLLSGCMLSAVLPAAGWLTIALGLALGLAACSSSSSSDGGGANETAALTVSGGSAYEGEGNVTFTVTLSGPVSNEVTLSYETSDGTAVAGTHYEQSAGDISFPANDTAPQLIVVPTLLDDALFNVARTFTLTISDPSASGATLEIDVAEATGKIRNDDMELALSTLEAVELEAFRQFAGPTASGSAGSAIAGGDFNGDGNGDALIGVPNVAGLGRGYVVFGSDSLPATTQLSVIGATDAGVTGFMMTPGVSSALGTRVAVPGDLDQDGNDDLLIGAPNQASLGLGGDGSQAGVAVFVRGGNPALANGELTTAHPDGGDAVFVDAASSSRFGRIVARAGDMNNDGTPDLLFGDERNNLNYGEVIVISGTEVGSFADANANSDFDTNAAFTGLRVTNSSNTGFATSLDGGCDFNGDGYSDIIIGEPYNDFSDTNAGIAHIIFGGDTVFDGTPASISATALGSDGLSIIGENAYDTLGLTVACVGDFDGDGFDDFVVGAPGFDQPASNDGTAFLVYGTDSTSNIYLDSGALASGSGVRINATASLGIANGFGRFIAGGGDLNDDGFPDFVVGSGSTTSTQTVFVIFGGSTLGEGGLFELDPLEVGRVAKITGQADDVSLGTALAVSADLDGDGDLDLLIGSPHADPNGANSGRAYVIFGSGF